MSGTIVRRAISNDGGGFGFPFMSEIVESNRRARAGRVWPIPRERVEVAIAGKEEGISECHPRFLDFHQNF